MLSGGTTFQDLDHSSTFSPELFTIGYTGHLYPGRGVSLIMDIAAQLPETNFLIVGGETSDVRKLRNEVRDRALGNVTLTGFVPNAELPAYQAACDVLLMPYRSRVSASSGGDIGRYLSPMKLFEYLASGRAICSSDLPVLQEILSPEIAVLLPPNDVEAWIAAIQRLIENPNFRKKLGKNARTAAQKYSWEARAEKIFVRSKPAN
jgi:glycosyltransferase involved in cell wall biosynthesis